MKERSRPGLCCRDRVAATGGGEEFDLSVANSNSGGSWGLK